MKKLTLLISCCLLSLNASSQITTYTSATDFHNAFPGNLVSENFEGGPSNPTICGMTISSQGDDCFTAGVVVPGFTLSASNNTDVIFLPSHFLPSENPTPRLGANTGVQFTILTFPGNADVHAVGHSLFVDNSADFNYRIYNKVNVLIYDQVTPFSPYFAVTSGEPIGRIEIQNVNNAGELIGDLEFEVESLSTIDQPDAFVNVYPIPASDVLNIGGDRNISKVIIFNMLGQTVMEQIGRSDNTYPISELPVGHFVLKVAFADGSFANKRIIKR